LSERRARRRVAVLTTGRQDYGILRSSLLLLQRDPRFELLLWVGGMHLSKAHGETASLLAADGLAGSAELDFLTDPPDPAHDSQRALGDVTRVLREQRPEFLVLLGDRYETLAAGFAATLAGVPLVHLHGGEETEGAIDNAMRHALTKLSHLHLVSHPTHARRVLQMGETPSRVIVVGAPGLDNLYRDDLPDRAALAAQLGATLEPPLVIVTLHPATAGGDAASEAEALSRAMERVPASYVITQPNSDHGGQAIRAHWSTWTHGRARVVLVDALGERRFFALLRHADAVLGNSSSGIIEAPSAGLPVVNVGDRQAGRLRSSHVIDVPAETAAIERALRSALAPETRARLRDAATPYLPGPAAPRIVEALANANFEQPPRKRFADMPGGVQP